MTISNPEGGEQKISPFNPQGNLPEIVPSKDFKKDFKEEQMEFSILTEIPLSTAEPETEIEVKAEADTEPEAEPEAEAEARTSFAPDSIPLTISEPISLPAALCDDLLLEEISAIPDKMGFKIGEVSDLLGIKQYVLRYWESEFEVLKPKKAHNNQRLFTKKNVENAFLIRKLLHRDRFSIEGARVALRGLKAHVKKEHQKEKEIKQAFHKMDTYHDRLENIALDIRKLRQLFKS